MSDGFVFMGNSITDRTNRITLVKLVAQRLGIDRKGYVEFYLLNGNIVIRRGEKDYDPNNGRSGFYMGSSIVDKDNRITLIRLVVQNLQIRSGNTVDFFLYREEVVIRETICLFEPFVDEIDVRTLSEGNKELVSKAIACFKSEFKEKMDETVTSSTALIETLAKVQQETLNEASPKDRVQVLRTVIQTIHKTVAPEEITGMFEKTIASYLVMAGYPKEELKERVEMQKRVFLYIDQLERKGMNLSEKKKRKLMDECGLERAENGKSIQMKKNE